MLHPLVGPLLPRLAALIGSLSCYDQIPQIEVAVDDTAAGLVFRHLVPLADIDRGQLISFGEARDLRIYLQPGGAETVRLLWPERIHLSYSQFGALEMSFSPTGFIQVNREVNIKLVKRALELLKANRQDRVLDLFCGIGNFTLPLATSGAEVVGIEGDAALIAQAEVNAKRNGLENTRFEVANLDELELAHCAWAQGGFSRVLLDPPRSGAFMAVQQMSKLKVQRIVYISCNPATLARDAGELVDRQGYRLRSAGVVDMFPHTTHVEVIALFEQPERC